MIGALLTSISSGYMAISIPMLFTALYFLQKLYLRTSQQLRSLDLDYKSPLLELFMESIQGLTTVRAYAWTEYMTRDAFSLLDQSQKPFYLLLCLQRWLTFMLNFIVTIIAVILMTLTVTLRHSVNPGLLGIALTSVMNFGQTLSSFILYWTTLETSLTAVTRIREYSSGTPNEDSPQQAKETPPASWPSEPSIQFHHVFASYR